jgi:nitrogen fixation protein FixH
MSFQEQTDKIRASVHMLDALPVRILKQITGTKGGNKSTLVADLAFNLDFSDIVVTESVLDSDFLVFKFNGKKVGAIDTRRGRQEFLLPSGEWSTDWSRFMAYLITQKRTIQALTEQQDESLDRLGEPKAITLQECDEMVERALDCGFDVIEIPGTLVDEYALIDGESGTADIIESHFVNSQQSRLTVRTVSADDAYEWAGDKVQDEYEDATDASLTDDERALIDLLDVNDAYHILNTVDEDDSLELITDEMGLFRVVNNDNDGMPIIRQCPETPGHWRVYRGTSFKCLTTRPNDHLQEELERLK